MTDPIVRASSADVPADLSALKLAELQQLATELGVVGVSKLRKGELVDAITQTQNAEGTVAEGTAAPAAEAPAVETAAEAAEATATDAPAEPAAEA
ncbi:MAG: Rho termination factor N-terminal domain-containing protein, partial [Yonghaparkia sp.]|nr:Rho termination factor N-terminal domain-containing protein [Microcella sp.]